jgi:hypothetical protein
MRRSDRRRLRHHRRGHACARARSGSGGQRLADREFGCRPLRSGLVDLGHVDHAGDGQRLCGIGTPIERVAHRGRRISRGGALDLSPTGVPGVWWTAQ